MAGARSERTRFKPKASRWRRPWIRTLVLGAAVVVMTLHAGACAAALLFLPRGFPLTTSQAWANTLLPAAVGIALILGLVRFVFTRLSAWPVAHGCAGIGGGWLAAVVTGAVLFPVSFDLERALGPAAIALALGALAWATRITVVGSALTATVGAAAGVVAIMAEQAPPPSTRPKGGTPADVAGEPTKDAAQSGQVSFPCGKDHVRVRPLLTFESRSPDATWTLLAPTTAFGPRRTFDGYTKEANGFRAHYRDDGETSLVVVQDSKGLDIEAISRLDRPVYSHLNAFTAVHVPFETTLAFSPIGPREFPVGKVEPGRPLELGYLGGDLFFHVVRASDAEKGPYTEIAAGHLGRDEALTLTIKRQDGRGSCRLTFKDWASQVSTEASPTAGWGVPQNSIQFSSNGKEALIVLTLAETGPGAGWQSVAHAEGTYKNRVRIDTIMDPSKTK